MDINTFVNIGIQRYDRLREQDQFYIDKTGFIREWWENGSDVTLITRPRRFGKTLNMSMLECFFRISMRAEVTCLRGFLSGRRKSTGSCRARFR